MTNAIRSFPVLAWLAILGCGFVEADEQPINNGVQKSRWAIIVVGLPGDKDHVEPFRAVANSWRAWLVETLAFEPQQVLVLDGNSEGGPVTGERIHQSLAQLSSDLREHDALWVFFLGHANYDGARAFFHVSGPDPDASMIGKWLSGVKCQEHIVWMTNSCAGWFVKPLAKPGRIVIAATAADFEFNETEFPHGLASATKKPAAELDKNQDQRVSLLEFFSAAVTETERIFQSDQRVPTEHAQLDDDGDGQGAELTDLVRNTADLAAPGKAVVPAKKEIPAANTSPKPKSTDGRRAATTYLPYRQPRTVDSTIPNAQDLPAKPEP